MTIFRKQKGFTLVELIVAIALFSIVVSGVVMLMSNIISSSTKQGNLLANGDQSRRLSFQITKELRNAVYSNAGAYPLALANDQELAFYSNLDGGQDVERVRYYVSSGKLYRGIVKPTGNPLAYNFATETSTVVQNDIANAASPLFYYYADTYNGTSDTPLTQPVNVTQAKFIKLDLRVFNKAGLKGTNYYTVTTGGSIRSLKSNLGN